MNPHETTADGRTLLMIAVQSEIYNDNRKMIDRLLTEGIDLNAQTTTGETALMFACMRKNELDSNIVFKRNSKLHGFGGPPVENSPLPEITPKTSIALHLIDIGADVNIESNTGQIALGYACESGHRTIIKSLIAAGSDVNIRFRYGRDVITMLQYACKLEDTPLIIAVIRAGAELPKFFPDRCITRSPEINAAISERKAADRAAPARPNAARLRAAAENHAHWLARMATPRPELESAGGAAGAPAAAAGAPAAAAGAPAGGAGAAPLAKVGPRRTYRKKRSRRRTLRSR
jgi:hypothetical protein